MSISEKNLRDHLDAIIGPKHHNTEEAEQRIHQVEEYIVEKLENLGYKTDRQRFEFETMTTAWGRVHKNRRGTNIIAEKVGKSDEVLILATHHDTVPGSPGADDNGSGIAAFLEIARLLADKELYYTIRLISFDLEEAGLIGSEYYVQQLPETERDKIVGMIMLEMLAYYTESQTLPQGFGLLYRKEIRRLKEGEELKGDFLTCVFRGDAKHIARAFKRTEADEKMKVALIREPVDMPFIGRILKWAMPSLQNLLRSDHTPFWFRQIPAVMMTDTSNFRNKHYHLPSDTIDTLDFGQFTRASQRVLDAILYLDENYRN